MKSVIKSNSLCIFLLICYNVLYATENEKIMMQKVNVFFERKNEQIVNKGEKTTMDVRTYLEQQQVHPQLIRAVEEFRNQYPVEEK